MFDFLLGGEPDPKYWKAKDRAEKEAHKKEVNNLKNQIAETQYLTNNTNRQIEITELQSELVTEQTTLANTQTQLTKSGMQLAKKIQTLNSAQDRYKQAIRAAKQRRGLWGLF